MKKNQIFSIKDVEILDNKSCYEGFLSISSLHLKHRLFEGGWSNVFSREIMLRAPGVGVLLYDPDLDKVLLVEQFRAGCLDNAGGPWVLELVAGIIDKDESTEEVAVREAREEAQVSIERLIPVCEYYSSPGGSNEKLSIYCARVDASAEPGVFGVKEENEDIRSVILTREDAQTAVETGVINNAMAIIAIQWLTLNLEYVKDVL